MLNKSILFVEHFVIPIAFLIWQWYKFYRSKSDAWIMALLVGVYVSRMYFVGDWHLYGYYFRYVFLGAFLLVTAKVLYSTRKLPVNIKRHPREKFGIILFAFFALLFIGIIFWAYLGQSYNGNAADLEFPLKNGTYYITEGGDSPVINEHHRLPPVPEKYALAIVKLNNIGKHAEGFSPQALSDFAIFSDTVYSPCAGIVGVVVDSFPDLEPPASGTETKDFLGNYIKITHQGYFVYLAHLQSNSLLVSAGNAVSAGQPIAKVGNSGISDYPHLLLKVTKKTKIPDFHWDEEGVPTLFEKRFLTKNMRLSIQ